MSGPLPPDKPEYLFIDESGDTGLPSTIGTNPIYILVGVHMNEDVIEQFRSHMTAFRYHHDVRKELKDVGFLLKDKPSPQYRALLGLLEDLTAADDITTSTNWLHKDRYKGPHLNPQTPGITFRNYQLRRLLERHKGRRQWGTNLDVVVDRSSMSHDQKRNLEDYIRGNWYLRPKIAHVTVVDSIYAEGIQIADMYARLARRVIEREATNAQEDLCSRLMNMREVTSGIY